MRNQGWMFSQSGRRIASAVLALAALLALAAAFGPQADALVAAIRGGQPAALAAATGSTQECDPAWRVVVKGVEICSHGPDPAPPGFSRSLPVQPLPERKTARVLSATPWCDGDGVSGRRVQVLYVREASAASNYAAFLNSFRTWAAEMDAIYSNNALMTGPDRHVRFVTGTGCDISVPEVIVPDGALSGWSSWVNAVSALGYNSNSRKYLAFADAYVYCGVGSFYGDEQTSAANASNTYGGYARVDRGCWSAMVAAHEIGHNLGAVNYSAPHTSGGGHSSMNTTSCATPTPPATRG